VRIARGARRRSPPWPTPPALPICYFLEPGHPRDKYDPNAREDAFQRFECLEGVKPPELALSQRKKLDAYRIRGEGWSILTLQ
jgi:hypothetical protein